MLNKCLTSLECVHILYTLSLFLIDIFHIFNLSLANSSEIYNDSLPICFSGLYSNQLSKWPNQTERGKNYVASILTVVGGVEKAQRSSTVAEH